MDRQSTRALRLTQVCEAVGLSRASIWRMVRCGDFPAPFKIGLRAVAWSVVEVDQWLADRMAERGKSENAS
jgi:prophage regulatory protein